MRILLPINFALLAMSFLVARVCSTQGNRAARELRTGVLPVYFFSEIYRVLALIEHPTINHRWSFWISSGGDFLLTLNQKASNI